MAKVYDPVMCMMVEEKVKAKDAKVEDIKSIKVYVKRNGYELGLNDSNVIYLAFPGETVKNPHMYLGRLSQENLTKGKQMFEKLAKAKDTKDAILGHVKEVAKILGISENDLEDRGYEKGYELVGHKKTGAILAKKNIRSGKMIVYKERMTEDGASGSRIDSFNIGADKYELIGWVHDNHYFSITIYKNNDEIKSWEFYNKKEMSQYSAKAKAEFGMLKKSFGSKAKDADKVWMCVYHTPSGKKVKGLFSYNGSAEGADKYMDKVIKEAYTKAILRGSVSGASLKSAKSEGFIWLDSAAMLTNKDKVKDGASMAVKTNLASVLNEGIYGKNARGLSDAKQSALLKKFISQGGSEKEYDEILDKVHKMHERKTKDAIPSNLSKSKIVNSKDRSDREMDRMLGNRGQYITEKTGIRNYVYKNKISKKIIGYYNDMSGDLYYDPKEMVRDVKTKDWTSISKGALASFDQNEYCFTVERFEQYALGPTGASRSLTLYVKSKDKGWPTLADAKAAAQSKGFKNYSKKGKADEGYGSVGAERMVVSFAKISKYESIVAKSNYSRWLSVKTFDSKAKDSERDRKKIVKKMGYKGHQIQEVLLNDGSTEFWVYTDGDLDWEAGNLKEAKDFIDSY